MTMITDVLPVVTRADHVPGPPQGRWTYEAYAALPDDGTKYEIVDGVLYMSPAPDFAHQLCLSRIVAFLKIAIEFTGRGIVLCAPFDVQLPGRPGVVQPDIIVILNANRHILTPARAEGAPDLVIEVASPSTAGYDRRTKQDAYARAGVREYWIVDPRGRTLELLVLDGEAYLSLGVYQGGATIPSRVVPDLPVTVGQFFAE